MRYTHGCKPRNPYNMIIQENHAAGRAIFIIAYRFKNCLWHANNHIEESKNGIHAVHHIRGEEFAKEEDEAVNNNNTVDFEWVKNFTKAIWGDCVENARTIEWWNWDQIKQSEAEICKDKLFKDNSENVGIWTIDEAGEVPDKKGDESQNEICKWASESD